jgi:hypothetical protein
MHSRALLASGRSLRFVRLNKERDALVTARAKKHHQDQLTQHHTLPGLSQINPPLITYFSVHLLDPCMMSLQVNGITPFPLPSRFA